MMLERLERPLPASCEEQHARIARAQDVVSQTRGRVPFTSQSRADRTGRT